MRVLLVSTWYVQNIYMEDKIRLAQQMVEQAEKSIRSAQKLLSEITGDSTSRAPQSSSPLEVTGASYESDDGQVVEGAFDGQNMVGPDGKKYSVPANYASKSKLVEGDQLKLIIQPDGRFVYKQIGPIERNRIKGVLMEDEASGQSIILAGGKNYKVLHASLTFFHAEVGDEVVILVPVDRESEWAAVENVIKEIDKTDEPELLENEEESNTSTKEDEEDQDDLGLISPLDDIDTI